MNQPNTVEYDSTNQRLFVGQSVSNRVTVYDVASITNGENAVHVLGQPNFTSLTSSGTQSISGAVTALAFDETNQRLFVGSDGNNRVLVFDVVGITDGENAVNVLGQSDFTSSGLLTNQSSTRSPRGLEYDSSNSRLYVVENSNQRVTIFDVAATTSVS
jgi:6-phosphogluconolactonase (cycloisomerase 2 family)